MKKKCSYANHYKAIKAPKCGCNICNIKWKEKKKWQSMIRVVVVRVD